jgi:DNA-directed RNA polymerase specialized sigma24 family protein
MIPGLVQARPLLEWLDDAFASWDWPLGNNHFAPDVPERITTPTALRRWLLAASTDYATRDQVWAQIVTASRCGFEAGEYRFLAVGLALAGLRNYRRRIHVRHVGDLPDVHADLVAGFLTRLASIDTGSRNVAGRLIDSAIGYAARRYRDHQSRPLPSAPATLTTLTAGSADGGFTRDPRRADPTAEPAERVLLEDLAARLQHGGVRVSVDDLELIAVTRAAGRSLAEAAAELGIPAEAAYKRRRRAEQRLATVRQFGWTPGSFSSGG